MTTQTLIWRLTLLYLALVITLGWLAFEGYILALVALTILVTVSIFGIGLLFGLGYLRQAGKQQQDAFVNNARENLAIMNAMQSLQNKQNQALLQQVRQLPNPSSTEQSGPTFNIEEGVFEQLDILDD
jgi:hypothetical protein